MKAKVLFLLTIAVLSLSAITLLSCSKDEDDSIHSGNTNLVGTWAEIDSPFDGKPDGFLSILSRQIAVCLFWDTTPINMMMVS